MQKRPAAPSEEERALESPLGRRLDTWLPEVIKRALFIGAGTLFLTEEGIRKALSEFNLPKDLVNYLVKQSEKSKAELLSVIQRELNRFLSRIDVTRISKEVLDGISLEIQGKITFHAKKKEEASAADSEAARPVQKKPRK